MLKEEKHVHSLMTKKSYAHSLTPMLTNRKKKARNLMPKQSNVHNFTPMLKKRKKFTACCKKKGMVIALLQC